MRLSSMVALATLIFVVSLASAAQSIPHQSDTILTRLSYSNSYPWNGTEPEYPRVCFALYADGHYRLSRLTQDGRVALEGTLSQRQLHRLLKLTEGFDAEFSGGDIVRQGAEMLLVDVMNGDKAVRHQWTNPDRRHPFPRAAIEIVEWLQNFKAEGASPLTLRDLGAEPICPPGSLKPLQPTMAGLYPEPTNFACGEQRQ